MKVAFFPYGAAQENPYQELLIKGLEANGIEVEKIPGRKFFPLLPVIQSKAEVIHMFWPHDLYIGRNVFTGILKAIMLLSTLPFLKKKVVIYSAENIASHMHSTDYSANELKWIQRILIRCKGIVMMNAAAPEVLSAYYEHLPEHQLIIPHVHYRSVYPDTVSFEEARAHLGLPVDVAALLVLGRIAPYKGIEDIIQAFSQLTHPDARLIIAGRSTDKQYMRVLKEITGQDQRIMLHDRYIQHDEVQYYFNAANAAIFNYQDIPLNPGSIIMAKCFGTRILAPLSPTLIHLDQGDMHFYSEGEMTAVMRQIVNMRPKPDKANINDHLAAHAPEKIGKKLAAFYHQCIQ